MLSSEMMAIIGPALAAGLIIAISHAPLGIEVLRRGIIFIDLAVAQIAGLGLIASSRFLHEPSAGEAQLLALLAAILAGLFFRQVEKYLPDQQEAIIGVSFVLAASLAILLLADHPQAGEEIQHLLSGQMLFVSWQDVAAQSPIYGLILLLWFLRPAWRQGMGFYVLFALAITAFVQLVGVYVVFASLILPALAASKAARPNIMAWLCGVTAVLSGVFLAVVSDAPAGPVIVVCYALTALAIRLLRASRSA